MKTIKHALIALIVGLTTAGQVLSAQEKESSEWVLIIRDSDDAMFYSGKKSSYELTTTKGGTPIAMVLGQIEDKKAKKFNYGRWYVTAAECEAGIGKLVILKVDGNYDMEVDYVSKGNNIASAIGDLICGIYLRNKKAREAKGV